MKLRSACLTVFTALALWAPVRAAEEPIDFLPEDTSIYLSYAKTKDTPALEDHPIYKAIATPAMKKAFAPLVALMGEEEERVGKIWKEETGLSLEEAKAKFTGTMAVGLRAPFAELDEKLEGSAAERPFDVIDVIGAAHFGGDEALAEKFVGAYLRILKDTQEHAGAKDIDFPKIPEIEFSAEDYAGVKLHLMHAKGGEKFLLTGAGWACVDKMIVFATSEKALQAAVDLGKKGGASLEKAPRFAALAEKAKQGNFTFYLDLQTTLIAVLKKASADAAKEVEPGQFDPSVLLRVLGAEKFDSVSLVGDFKNGAVTAEFALNFHDKPGLASLIAVDGPGTVPEFLPPNAMSGAYGTFYPDRMMDAVEKLVKEAYPQGWAAIAAQLDVVKGKTGVDLKKDLLANLGPDIWSVAGEFALPGKLSDKIGDEPSPLAAQAMQPQVFGIRLKDKKAFQLALTSILNYAAPDQALFDDREYQGYTIRNFKSIPVPVGYVLSDDWLMVSVGPQALLEDVLGRLKTPGGRHLFGQAHIKEALAAFPPGEDGTSYLDFGTMLQTMVTLFRRLPDVAGLNSVVDLKALPENLNLHLGMISRTYLDDKGYRVRLRLEEKSK